MIQNTDFKIEIEDFSFSERGDVVKFECMLKDYLQLRLQTDHVPFNLSDAFESLQGRSDGGRIFAALFDIQLSYIFLLQEFLGAASAINSSAVSWDTSPVTESQVKFFSRMDTFRHNSNFILKYRSLWDKILGFLVLLIQPDAYQLFCGSPSRLKAFRKIFTDDECLPTGLLNDLLEHIRQFDDKYRTAEAHLTGSIRKKSFSSTNWYETPTVDLSAYWNFVNSFIGSLERLLKICVDK